MKDYDYIPLVEIGAHTTSRVNQTADFLIAIGQYLKNLGNDRIQIALKVDFALEKKKEM